ncbi:MAG: asparagine synthetase [Candidatus Thermoplasmatota archaeon]|nr:asparagine synthetase [Candidatus Thermoplasmatota archaeon]
MKPRASEKTQAIMKIQSEIRRVLATELRKRDFIELSPVILSPVTDPLNHPTAPMCITCYGDTYNITQSMIFHKQLALRTLNKIFIFSPNVRIEPLDKKDTGRHLFEFSQLDLEVKGATREEMMSLCEELLVTIILSIKKQCKKELNWVGRKLRVPKIPFKRISYCDAHRQYGKNFEVMISQKHPEPVWIIDIPLNKREFYDREDEKNPGYLRDMDLLYPEGYGEALSGGEREYSYNRIKKRIHQKGQKVSAFASYLELAKNDLPPSAGFGIGIERLTQFICGLSHIREASLFPKIPGKRCL